MSNKAIKVNSIISKIVMSFFFIVLIIFALSLIYPIVWTILTSLKDSLDFAYNQFGLPEVLAWQNYKSIFSLLKVTIKKGNDVIEYGLPQMFLNNVIFAALTPITTILSTTFTAYAVSKYKFKGRAALQYINIIVMIVPIVGSLPSALTINKLIGRYDNMPLMILLGASPFGFNMLLMYNAFKSIPWDYAEAAMIDGAGHFTVLFKIILPQMISIMAVLYILAFIGYWNDYMTILIWLPSYPNLALGMYLFQYEAGKYAATLPEVLAGFVIVSIPSVVLFVCSQGLISKKLAVGGLKG